MAGRRASSLSERLEILWHSEPGRDFLNDLRTFCQSMDCWEMTLDLKAQPGRRIHLDDGDVTISSAEVPLSPSSFRCPDCEKTEFDVVEGELEGKVVLGLACLNCNSYGILASEGL